MPKNLLRKAMSYLTGRKEMPAVRKKRKKKKGAHYSNPTGADVVPGAGQMRARNRAVKSQLDELEG